MKKIYIYLTVSSLILTACGHKHSPAHDEEDAHEHIHGHAHEGHNHEAEEENPAHPNAIAFSEAQQSKIDFETALPTKEPFGQVIKTIAQVQSSQADEIIISAKASGIAVFSGNNLVEGKPVSAGQQLFTISGAGLAENNAEVRFTEAKANFTKAEAAYERAKSLIEDKIISQKDFLETQTEYETSKSVYNNLTQNFSNRGQRVSSSIPGYIKQIYVSNGQYVEEGRALISISKNKSLLLKAEIQPKYASLLPFIFSATVKTMDSEVAYSLEELNGEILSYGKSISDDNYLLPVNIQIDNKAGFVPGGFVEVYLKTKSDKEILTVPSSAITEEQGVFFVYVQLNPESFEKREVSVGMTDGIRTEIRSGLDISERVVSKGAISVKLAQSAGALDPHAGHVH